MKKKKQKRKKGEKENYGKSRRSTSATEPGRRRPPAAAPRTAGPREEMGDSGAGFASAAIPHNYEKWMAAVLEDAATDFERALGAKAPDALRALRERWAEKLSVDGRSPGATADAAARGGAGAAGTTAGDPLMGPLTHNPFHQPTPAGARFGRPAPTLLAPETHRAPAPSAKGGEGAEGHHGGVAVEGGLAELEDVESLVASVEQEALKTEQQVSRSRSAMEGGAAAKSGGSVRAQALAETRARESAARRRKQARAMRYWAERDGADTVGLSCAQRVRKRGDRFELQLCGTIITRGDEERFIPGMACNFDLALPPAAPDGA